MTPRKPAKSKHIGLWVTTDMWKRLTELAQDDRRSLSDWLRLKLETIIKEREK